MNLPMDTLDSHREGKYVKCEDSSQQRSSVQKRVSYVHNRNNTYNVNIHLYPNIELNNIIISNKNK